MFLTLSMYSAQIWNLGSPEPNFTLEAHQKGVNCVEYFSGGDRPYLITGSDDQTAKVMTLSCLLLILILQVNITERLGSIRLSGFA